LNLTLKVARDKARAGFLTCEHAILHWAGHFSDIDISVTVRFAPEAQSNRPSPMSGIMRAGTGHPAIAQNIRGHE
jgi:hypothetical protein